MTKSLFSKILILFIPAFSFFFIGSVFAETDCGTVCATAPSCPGGSGYNYQCSGNCPNSRYQRQLWQYNCWAEGTGWNTECSCYTSYSCECDPPTYGAWEDAESCDSWQECSLTPVGGNHCVCQGSCLATPTNPSPSNGEQNVKLPVTFSWSPANGAGSYRYKIDGILEDFTVNAQKTIDEEGDCLLKSNANYNWGVKACCTADGTNCGSWSNSWGFKTSLAPQLVSPKNNTIDVLIPDTLDWCGVESAQSYFVQIYKDSALYWSYAVTKQGGSLETSTSLGLEVLTKKTPYEWEIAPCLNENGTKCGVNCTDGQDGEECGDFSYRWVFTTASIEISPPELTAPFYDLTNPNEIPAINQSNSLQWDVVLAARSYRYEIKKNGAPITIPDSLLHTVSLSVSFKDLWEYLEFDTEYSWHAQSCWDENGENCEGVWSAEWKFKTTGAKPSALETDAAIIPVKLNWEDIPGVAVYNFEVATDSGFSNVVIPENQRTVEISEVLADYPDLHQDTSYYWRVKTCADGKGEDCGEWSNSQNFKTFRLATPTNPVPADDGKFYTYEHYLRWDATPGAKFYQYKIDYGGTEKIPPTIVSVNFALIPIEQLEVGNYSWYVMACLDKECHEAGEQTGPWHFILEEQSPPTMGSGLVPCGRYVNANDPYGIDERQTCQFSHIFLLLRNILDFILWKLGLIVLALLVAATGFVFYFSMGAPETMNKVKSILKSAGTGYMIVFISWTIIDLILKILGYKVGLPWWNLQF